MKRAGRRRRIKAAVLLLRRSGHATHDEEHETGKDPAACGCKEIHQNSAADSNHETGKRCCGRGCYTGFAAAGKRLLVIGRIFQPWR
jgi:hypothetical protein